ncbi:hypothetical protein OSTOST_25148 [Ostertagia ostertagi]
MDLCVMPRLMNRVMYDAMRDFDRFEKKHFPIVDDDKKFAVSLDVSQFRPEELNVHLEGRELTSKESRSTKLRRAPFRGEFWQILTGPIIHPQMAAARKRRPGGDPYPAGQQGPFVRGGAEESRGS